MSAEWFLSHIRIPLSQLLSRSNISPLLEHVITDVLPASLIGSTLASGRAMLELARAGSAPHGGNFWHVLIEAAPAGPPLPKPCYENPRHYVWERGSGSVCK